MATTTEDPLDVKPRTEEKRTEEKRTDTKTGGKTDSFGGGGQE